MKAAVRVFTLMAMLAVVLGSVQVFGQANVNEEEGMLPYRSWQGGDFESVSMTNGGLVLHIPLVSIPQRGKLDLSFSVFANTKQWKTSVNQVECANPNDPNGCTPFWVPIGRGGSAEVALGNTVVEGAYVASSLDWIPLNDCFASQGTEQNGFTVTYNWSASLVAPDGGAHSFGNGSFINGPGCPTPPYRALDASGILQSDANTIIFTNGIRFTFDSAGTAAFTDSNGNRITLNTSGNYTDTMGRVIPMSSTATTDLSDCPAGTSSARTWSFPGLAGSARTFKFCISTNISIYTNFAPLNGAVDYGPKNDPLLTAIVLPDKTLWRFDYDHFGNVTRLGYPTGGSVSYKYAMAPSIGCGGDGTPASQMVTSRTVNANDGTGDHVFKYAYSISSTGPGTMVVTDPDGNDTVHTIADPATGKSGCFMLDTQVRHYQGSQASGKLLATETTQYSFDSNPLAIPGNGSPDINVVPKQVTNTLANGLSTRVVNTWDSGNSNSLLGTLVPVVLGSLLQEDEYDFTNTLVRSTAAHYLWQDNATYKNNNFVSLVSSGTVKDVLGNQLSQSTYGYDETNVTPSGVTTNLVAAPAGGNIRGNMTRASSWLNTTGNLVPGFTTYFDTGMKASNISPKANAFDLVKRTTTYTYDTVKFFGAYLTQTNMPDTVMPDQGATGVHHVVSGDYDFNTGLLTKFTDENGNIFTFKYDAQKLWLAQANHPDLGQTSFFFPNPTTVERRQKIDSTRSDDYFVYFDGLGRSIQSQQITPDNCNPKVDTTYDNMGRVAATSNPYCVKSDPTYGVTQYRYDALGRATSKTKQDGSVSTASFNQPAVFLANVDCTLITDEAGKPSKACADGLGRLIEVDEPNAASLGASSTASITISGSPASTPAASAVLAATNSPIVRAGIAGDFYYLDTNGHIRQVTQMADATWAPWDNADITTATGAPAAISGSPLMAYRDSSGRAYILYVTLGQHLEVVYYTTNWFAKDLTAAFGGGLLNANTRITMAAPGDFYYVDAIGHVHEASLLPDGTWASWTTADITSLTGAAAAIAGSNIVGYQDISGRTYVLYVTAAQHLGVVYYTNNWFAQDLTATFGGGLLNANTRITMAAPGDFYYVDAIGHVREASLLMPNGTWASWTTADITGFTGAAAAITGSNIVGYQDVSGRTYVLYVTAAQHVQVVYYNNNWFAQDLTNSFGGILAAAGTQVTQASPGDFYYLDSAGHLRQATILADGTWARWTNADITGLTGAAAAGGNVVAASGVMKTLLYVTSGQHLEGLSYNNNNQWWAIDLSIASVTPYDAGTVSLNVGGFSVTSCYGASTNPTCSGQAVNNTASAVASALSQLLNGSGSPVTATASGTTINMSWKTVGPNTAAVSSLSTVHDNPTQYPNPSFTSPATSFSGGQGIAIDGSAYVTLYSYDLLGNLLCVEQHGGVGGTGCSAPPSSDATSPWHVRRFTYDSFSRLLTSSNPESGAISYTADNLHLISKTDARGNTTNYTYDALNRPLDVSYNAPSAPTPTASFRYDYASFNGQTLGNPIGRLVASFTGSNNVSLTGYDAMGRPNKTVQCIPGVTACQTFTASYDMLGDALTVNYPGNAFSVAYAYDGAARMTSATDSNQFTYANNPLITAFGTMQQFSTPNFNYKMSFNNRLQPTEISAVMTVGTPPKILFDKTYSYNPPALAGCQVCPPANNGNIYVAANKKDDTRTQTFTYDPLSRLLSANDKTHWGNTYTYDQWGNLYQKNPGVPGGPQQGENLQKSADGNNRLSGMSYDADGNVTYDGSHHYSYDAENRINCIDPDPNTGQCTSTSTSYIYDAWGRRITKVTGSTRMNYWYSGGSVRAETDSAGSWTNYIFFAGRRLARNIPQPPPSPADIKYYIGDHLGSTAVLADQSGKIIDENDFLPWGGLALGVGTTGSNNHYLFTGKERDPETGLDYFGARYYSSALGRFISSDWSAVPVPVPYANMADPQSLNLYSYVRNSPITRVDPDGHDGQEGMQSISNVGETLAQKKGGLIDCTGPGGNGPDKRCRGRKHKMLCPSTGRGSECRPMPVLPVPAPKPLPLIPITPIPLPRVPLGKDNPNHFGCWFGGQLALEITQAATRGRELRWKAYYEKHPDDPSAIAHKEFYASMPETPGPEVGDSTFPRDGINDKESVRYQPMYQGKRGKRTEMKPEGEAKTEGELHREGGRGGAHAAHEIIEAVVNGWTCEMLGNFPIDEPPDN